jgi:hypothetical protein
MSVAGETEARVPPIGGHPAIEVRVEEVSQLFDNLDPFPFRERDLDKHAEEFIVGWARELRPDQPLRIVIHLPRAEAETPHGRQLGAALTRYFAYRAEVTRLELNELFRVGWRSGAIGVAVLALSLLAAQTESVRAAAAQFGRLVEESLIIFGWVANWKPIEIFLYEWWPVVRRRNLYRRLAAATVELRPADAPTPTLA